MSKFVEDYRGNSILFLKFIEEEYLESFLSGNIYANNFEYFQKLEALSGERGIGDKNDGCLPIFNLQNITFQNNETGQIAYELPELPVIRISTELDSKTAVFCLYEMKAEDFVVINEDENEIRLLLRFTEEQRNSLRNEFKTKSHVVIIEPTLFINRLIQVCQMHNLIIDYKRVQYYQHGVNDEKRLSDFNNNTSDKCFWKEDYFKKQNEFRVVFRNKQIDHGQIILNIGNLLDFGLYMTIDELLNKEYILVYNLLKK